jgi:hypothetical protein
MLNTMAKYKGDSEKGRPREVMMAFSIYIIKNHRLTKGFWEHCSLTQLRFFMTSLYVLAFGSGSKGLCVQGLVAAYGV